MRRRTHQRWLRLSQELALAGPLALAVWNLTVLLLPVTLPDLPWWSMLLAPLPGLLAWGVALGLPVMLARQSQRANSYRLTWDTSPGWDDARFRQSLRNLIVVGGGIDLVWARDGAGLGCWLLVDDDRVLARLVADILPGGSLEADPYPPAGQGAVVLHWREEPPPPSELCRETGVDGVYYRWLSETDAVTALWGEGATTAARRYARDEADLLLRTGATLLSAPFVGDNPWPGLPPFPPSQAEAGLSSVSRLTLSAPALRVVGRGGVVLGLDGENHAVGFDLPQLEKLRQLRMYGQVAADQSVMLALQAIRAGVAVAFLDGDGTAAGRLQRRLVRELAAGQVLTCDAERPAQSKLRLNPLWLPAVETVWPAILTGSWPVWLRELGVTPAGLGLTSYRHTLVAVILTALLAARRGLALDPAALLETLDAPDYLARAADTGGADLFGVDLWAWWQAEGRYAHNFDVHLRVGHLRERLSRLLSLPEYRMLWRAPYIDPGSVVSARQSLIWRLPDPRRRLRGYVTSQLLALSSQLAARQAGNREAPLLLVLYEIENSEEWAPRLSSFAAARVVLASRRVEQRSLSGQLLFSRLERDDAEWVHATGVLNGIPAADLRRLPDTRLIMRRGQDISTVEISG
ncbi:MAG: hypothetical protein Kow0031_24570 [Anaerolineae bacterium]